MTDEKLDLASANASEAGVTNVEFKKGYVEALPLADASVDVVISNCVINLSGDIGRGDRRSRSSPQAGRAFRRLRRDRRRQHGRSHAADMAAWTGCIAGALTATEFERALTQAAAPHAETILASREGRCQATQYTATNFEHIPAQLLAHQMRGVASCTAVLPFIDHALREGWAAGGAPRSCEREPKSFRRRCVRYAKSCTKADTAAAGRPRSMTPLPSGDEP